MTFFDSIILGIVEGVTEFLPISSTGHLILASELLGIPQTDFVKSFEIAIQLGAILAVVVLYWRRFLTSRKAVMRIIAAFLPTAVLGLVFYSLIKTYLLGNPVVVLLALALGGAGLVLFEKWYAGRNATAVHNDIEELSIRQAVAIGLFQSFAMVPGVSRAAATILGGLFLGLGRKAIVEFSFLLAVPTMLAATGLDLLKSAYAFTPKEAVLLVTGLFISFVVAIGAIKFLLNYIERHSFTNFGWYRIAVAAVFAVILFL